MERKDIILLGGGALVGYYLYTYYRASKTLTNAMYTFDDIFLVGYDSGSVVFGVRVNVRATGQLDVTSLNLNLYCNSQRLGRLVLPYPQMIVKGETTLMFNLYVKPSDLTQDIVAILTSRKVTFSVGGAMTFNGLPIKFPSILVAQDTLNNLLNQYVLPNVPYIGSVPDYVNVQVQGQTDGRQIFMKRGYSKDIIDVCCMCLRDNVNQTLSIAEYIKANTMSDKDAILELVDFMIDRFEYEIDPVGEQIIKTPSRFLSDGKGDCKAYSIFISSVLTNMNITNWLRFVDYSGEDYTHVYCVALIDGKEFPIDVVALICNDIPIGFELFYKRNYDVCKSSQINGVIC